MKKFILSLSASAFLGTFFLVSSVQAGSKCYYHMVCGGNSNIKANVCTTDCNDSGKKEKAKEWFKKKCSSASKPSQYKSGWKNCDVKF